MSTTFAFKCECFLFVFIWFFSRYFNFCFVVLLALRTQRTRTQSWFVHHLFSHFLFKRLLLSVYATHTILSVRPSSLALFLRFVSVNLTFWFDGAHDLQYKYGKVNRCVAANGEKICLLTFVLHHNRLLSRKKKKRERKLKLKLKPAATSQQMKKEQQQMEGMVWH